MIKDIENDLNVVVNSLSLGVDHTLVSLRTNVPDNDNLTEFV